MNASLGEVATAVAAASASISSGITIGVVKLWSMRRNRNGATPVTKAEAEACQKFQAAAIENLKEHLRSLEKKQDRVIDILLKGTM